MGEKKHKRTLTGINTKTSCGKSSRLRKRKRQSKECVFLGSNKKRTPLFALYCNLTYCQATSISCPRVLTHIAHQPEEHLQHPGPTAPGTRSVYVEWLNRSYILSCSPRPHLFCGVSLTRTPQSTNECIVSKMYPPHECRNHQTVSILSNVGSRAPTVVVAFLLRWCRDSDYLSIKLSLSARASSGVLNIIVCAQMDGNNDLNVSFL